MFAFEFQLHEQVFLLLATNLNLLRNRVIFALYNFKISYL
jgi:hypothetical protein